MERVHWQGLHDEWRLWSPCSFYAHGVSSPIKSTSPPASSKQPVPTSGGIDIAGTLVPFCDTVKLLSVTLDSALSMDRHVTRVVCSCNYHIRALRHIRPLLTPDVVKMLTHSIVTSRLDCANALLSGTTPGNLDRLQMAQNSLARVVCQASRSASATKLRQQLHWLPIRQWSLTNWRSSPTAHDQPAHQSTWRTSSKTTTHLAPCDQLIKYYCLYRESL